MPIKFSLCEDNFEYYDDTYIQRLGISENFYCRDNSSSNVYLHGNYYSADQYNYVQLSVVRCRNLTGDENGTCASDADINTYFQDL